MISGKCEICGNTIRNNIVNAREMMFGTRECFKYLECSSCGCLQLVDVPSDLSKFYPHNYYSRDQVHSTVDDAVTTFAKRARAHMLLRAPVSTVEAVVRARRAPAFFLWLAGLGLHTSSAVCDVGSGSGQSLIAMARQGFSNLSGVDPYISDDTTIAGQISVQKLGVDDLRGSWDLIMLNHSFEHMANPAVVLEHLRQCLSIEGRIIVRIPVADSYAWRTYGPNWVQLDAPRHLFIHTQRSMNIIARSAGLKVSRLFFDSYALQFWGSEQYQRGIPLRDIRSYAHNPQSGLFSVSEINEFDRRASALNKRGDGDSAGFVLRAM